MNRINQLFKDKKSGILSIYFCAGAPRLESTIPTLQAIEKGGADLCEIGVPFSDPMADGPVIQSAATQALKNGMSLKKLFEQLKDIRQTVSIPLILMGYLNVFFQYGFENFCKNCKACGIDGLIIPDLPFDIYMKDYKAVADMYNLRIIMLITPETSEERIRLIDNNTNGFIYEVSTDATTGTQKEFGPTTITYFKKIQNMKLKNPTLVGFGISNKATLSAAHRYAAGAIIGSKFVHLTSEYSSPIEAFDKLTDALSK